MYCNLFKSSIASLAAACIGIGASAAMAQMAPLAPAAPSTAPASQPAAAADSTTPKGTLTMLSRATQSGDSASVRDLFHASNPQQEKMIELMLERTSVFAKFRQALVAKFGEEAAMQLTGNSAADEAAAEVRINQAVVKIDGEKAAVQMKAEMPGEQEPDPVQMVKVDGKWKLPMAVLTEGMPAADIESNLRKVKMLSDVVISTTTEVTGGKFKTAEEVNDAIRGKLASAMLAEAAAAESKTPATMPTTGPALP